MRLCLGGTYFSSLESSRSSIQYGLNWIINITNILKFYIGGTNNIYI